MHVNDHKSQNTGVMYIVISFCVVYYQYHTKSAISVSLLQKSA